LSRLITQAVIVERIIYGRRNERFIEGKKANFAAGLNCTTLQLNLTGLSCREINSILALSRGYL
jgi:hypothetical protein